MKTSSLVASLICLIAVTAAEGAVIFQDNFDSYTNGNLVGQGSWQQTAVATPTLQVSSARAVLGTSGQDVYAAYSSPLVNVDGTSFYIGMTLNVTAAQAAGDYFLHDSSPAGTTTAFYDRLFAKSSGAGFVLGYVETSGTGSAVTYGTTVLNFNTDYRVILAHNSVVGSGNDTATLYVNPTDNTIEGNNTAYHTHSWGSATAELTSEAAINFRQGSAAAAASLAIDDVVVATTFGEAAVYPVPEPTTFALGVLGLGGLCLIRKKRAA